MSVPASTPQVCSQLVICSISGPCAALICAARSLTCGLAARVGARSAISMAPWWWTIIICANVTSASLCVDDDDPDMAGDDMPEDDMAPGDMPAELVDAA